MTLTVSYQLETLVISACVTPTDPVLANVSRLGPFLFEARLTVCIHPMLVDLQRTIC